MLGVFGLFFLESKQQIRGEPSKMKGVEERTGVTKSSPKHLMKHLGMKSEISL